MPKEFSAEEIVTACYRTLLMREPDKAGLFEHAKLLTNGSGSLNDLLLSFVNSTEFNVHSAQPLPSRTLEKIGRIADNNSQFGELSLLLKEWVNNQARHRLIVDVGARGRDRSNSYDLLLFFGWQAFLIEANPALVSQIRSDFEGLRFELLNVAVSDYEGRATFHIGTNDDVSSLTEDTALAWGEVRATVEVDVKRLGPLLSERSIPLDFDLLSLDIEGEDLKVLRDLVETTTYRPRWIIIEASHDFATKSIKELGMSESFEATYQIVGQTAANLILKNVG